MCVGCKVLDPLEPARDDRTASNNEDSHSKCSILRIAIASIPAVSLAPVGCEVYDMRCNV